MDLKGHNLVKRWVPSVKYLELPKLKPLLLLVNAFRKEGPNPISNDQFQNSPNPSSKKNKPKLCLKRSNLPKRRNLLFATNVAK